MSKLPSFLRQEDSKIIFDKDNIELVFYIPEIYFEREYCMVIGQDVQLFGMFDYSLNDKDGKSISGLKQFKYPTEFYCKPYSVEKKKDLKLTKNTKIQDYRLLKFKKDDIVITSVKVPATIANVETFYKMFATGIFPNTIPYNELHEYFLNAIKINGENYGVSSQLFGIIISEAFRDQNDLSTAYRLSNTNDQTAYTMINIKTIPKLVSAFTAFTSENFDESIGNAIINKNHKESPLERLFLL